MEEGGESERYRRTNQGKNQKKKKMSGGGDGNVKPNTRKNKDTYTQKQR